MVVASAGCEMTIWEGWAAAGSTPASSRRIVQATTRIPESVPPGALTWQCRGPRRGEETCPRASSRLSSASNQGPGLTRSVHSFRSRMEASMSNAPVASYSLTVRLRIANSPGMLGKVTSAIGAEGGDIGGIDIVDAGREMTRDISFKASDEAHGQRITERLRRIEGVTVVHVSDRTFLMHLGGKIEVNGRVAVKTRDDLSMAYTPGVARVCMAIHQDPEKAYTLTIKQNTVAVVSDGSAVLGLGDIGPNGAQPVMEGKALIFKSFAGVDAFPLCLNTKNVDEIVTIVKAVAPVFGGINLEDISAPRCFEIEERLQRDLDIPVFHDDQHGTAVVVLAALINALKIVGKKLSDARIVFTGAGASGIATAKLLMLEGARHIIGCDRAGTIYRGRTDNMNSMKQWFAEHTNADGLRGSAGEALKGADVFIGLSGPGVVSDRKSVV